MVGVVIFWCLSFYGLAADKAQLKRKIQRLEDPVNAHRLRAAQLTELLTTRKTEMEAAEKTLAAAEDGIHHYSLRSNTDPQKIAAQTKIDRAHDHFNKARDMRDRANQALQEHMEADPHAQIVKM